MCVAVCPLSANNVFKLFFLLMTKCETIVIFYLFIMYTYLKGLFKQLHYFFMINVFQVKSVIFSHRRHFFFLIVVRGIVTIVTSSDVEFNFKRTKRQYVTTLLSLFQYFACSVNRMSIRIFGYCLLWCKPCLVALAKSHLYLSVSISILQQK